MASMKSYLIEKNLDILSSTHLETMARFTYSESDSLQELLRKYKNEKKFPSSKIINVLTDSCLTFESISYKTDSYSNHEDLIEVGYILGLLHSRHRGQIIGVEFDKMRFYFIGVEADVFAHLKSELNKLK